MRGGDAGSFDGAPARVATGRRARERRAARGRRWRWLRWVALAVGVLVLALAVGVAFIDEPLRKRTEAKINASLKGYHASIGELDLQPFGFALVLKNVTLVKDSAPKPPVLHITRWKTSVHWRALLSGALVADARFEEPRVFVTLTQAQAEAREKVPPSERGWQRAVEAVYPLKINELRIVRGEITYRDEGKMPPVEMRDVDLYATNIRNVRSRPDEYPSPVHLEATLFRTGKLTLDGDADFLAEPNATLRADVDLADVPLAPVEPIAHHWGVELDGGKLKADAKVEYGSRRKQVVVSQATIDGAKVDYVKRSEADEKRLDKAKRATTDAEAAPAVEVDVEKLTIANGTLGFESRTGDRPYRLYLSDLQANLRDFSNRKSERNGNAQVRGKFMDSGNAALDASFGSGKKKPEFKMDVRIEDVDLTKLNDVLLATGGFDVNTGRFSLYSEISVHDGWVDGYVKPMFADLDVYDSRKDADKDIFHKAWEAIVGAAGTVLENRPRDEVATVADLSGPVENPNSSALQILVRLLQNAFFKAILPGLERGEKEKG
ncbi:MAG TPA: DUF748 domain-containing protein [Candidatus Binatia bacterium]|nr:DUF748 domain-containing protein [Candidatus Binatia bacterium]